MPAAPTTIREIWEQALAAASQRGSNGELSAVVLIDEDGEPLIAVGDPVEVRRSEPTGSETLEQWAAELYGLASRGADEETRSDLLRSVQNAVDLQFQLARREPPADLAAFASEQAGEGAPVGEILFWTFVDMPTRPGERVTAFTAPKAIRLLTFDFPDTLGIQDPAQLSYHDLELVLDAERKLCDWADEVGFAENDRQRLLLRELVKPLRARVGLDRDANQNPVVTIASPLAG